MAFTEAKERAKAFGVYGAISGGGAAIGLISGGVLTEYASWRWCLLVNVPIAIMALRRRGAVVHESKAQGNTRYDIPGAIIATAGLGALVYGFTKAANRGTRRRLGAGMTITISWSRVVLLVGVHVMGAGTKHPLLPMRVVLDRNRGTSYLCLDPGRRRTVRHVPVPDLLPAADAGHYSPLKSGVAYLPFSVGIIVGRRICRAAPARVGPRILLTAGGVLSTARCSG